MTSCAWMTRTEYKYVKPDLPEMKIYIIPAAPELGKLVNKGNTTCIIDWNVCLPKIEFKELPT